MNIEQKAKEYADRMNSYWANDHEGFVEGARYVLDHSFTPVTVEDAERFFREMTGIEGEVNSVNFESPSDFYQMMAVFCASHTPFFFSVTPKELKASN